MPPWLTVTLISQIVRCVGANSMIGTGVGGARCEDLRTSGSTIWKLTQTGKTCHSIHTSALVQTGTRRAFIDVHLAEVTCKQNKKTKQLKQNFNELLEMGKQDLILFCTTRWRQIAVSFRRWSSNPSSSPLKPWRHLQMKPLSWSMHVPAFWQGLGKQSFLSRSQFFPTHPGSQSQR